MADIASKTDSRMLWQLTVEEFESMLQKAAKAASPREDKLLTIEQVCDTLNVSDEWLYHHAKELPFVRKIGGMLRFSNNGLQRYIESAKFSLKSAKGD
jgi:excisionase family DNA binding protein